MGVCFIGKRVLPEFLSSYIDQTPGRYICIDSGNVVGNHKAVETLTIGQGARVGGASKRFLYSISDSMQSFLLL
jgi:tRNA U34 2-thiouridine synthase MnmA/TrmU